MMEYQEADATADENSGIQQKCSGTRKAAHTYTIEDRMILLRQVAGEIPFEGTDRAFWDKIHSGLKDVLPVNALGIQRKVQLLLKKFKEREKQSVLASGVDEEEDEEVILLTGIMEYMPDGKLPKRAINNAGTEKEQTSSLSKTAQEKRDGDAVRDAALTNMSPTSSSAGEPESGRRLKRKQKDDILEVIGRRDDAALKLKQEELALKKQKLDILQNEKSGAIEFAKMKFEESKKRMELEERKLALEERKFIHQQEEMEMERIHRQQKFDLEMDSRKTDLEEKKCLLQLLSKQNSL